MEHGGTVTVARGSKGDDWTTGSDCFEEIEFVILQLPDLDGIQVEQALPAFAQAQRIQRPVVQQAQQRLSAMFQS